MPKNLPLHTDPRLRELNFGDWEDRPWGEVYRAPEGEILRFNGSDPTWRAPGGENLTEAGERLRPGGGGHRPGQSGPDRGHLLPRGTAIRQFLAHVQGLGPEQWKGLGHSENTAVSCLEYEDGKFTVRFQNDASHLPESLTTLGKQQWWKKEGKART